MIHNISVVGTYFAIRNAISSPCVIIIAMQTKTQNFPMEVYIHKLIQRCLHILNSLYSHSTRGNGEVPYPETTHHNPRAIRYRQNKQCAAIKLTKAGLVATRLEHCNVTRALSPGAWCMQSLVRAYFSCRQGFMRNHKSHIHLVGYLLCCMYGILYRELEHASRRPRKLAI